ncbi:MAG: hypothetical protein KDA05_10725, partial [Phycisphaerales bacterium]|nr:hypothetical protein [Phycisphaerales bacterium]
HTPGPLPILAFLTRPDIQPWLDAHRTLAAHARRHAALDALTRSLATTTDPAQLRLAATAILHYDRPDPQPKPTQQTQACHRPAQSSEQVGATNPTPPTQNPHAHDQKPTGPTRGRLDPCAAHATPSTNTFEIEARQDRGDRTGARVQPSCEAIDATTDFDSEAAAIRAFNEALTNLDTADHPDADPDIDDALQDQLDDQLEDALEDAEIQAAAAADPLLAAALTGDPDAIHHFYLARTGAPPDPTLAAALARALQPTTHAPTHPDG